MPAEFTPAEFTFAAEMWLYQNKGAWTFVTLPKRLAREIRALPVPPKPSGSIRVTAIIGRSCWKTSIFRDSKADSYVLPIKAAVRAGEQIRPGETITISLLIEADEAE